MVDNDNDELVMTYAVLKSIVDHVQRSRERFMYLETETRSDGQHVVHKVYASADEVIDAIELSGIVDSGRDYYRVSLE